MNEHGDFPRQIDGFMGYYCDGYDKTQYLGCDWGDNNGYNYGNQPSEDGICGRDKNSGDPTY